MSLAVRELRYVVCVAGIWVADTSSATGRSSSYDALEEDRRTAWVPDALGEADLPVVLSTRQDLKTWSLGNRWLDVPRPDGRSMRVVVLPWPAIADLHLATEALRDQSDARLLPGVCGYRRGAQMGTSYSREFQRFCEITLGEAEQAAAVIYADVRGFFRSVPWSAVLEAARTTAGEQAAREVAQWADRASGEGLRYLPAGYADARLLSNLVLASVDERLGVPFARWVDDYRLFPADASTVDGALSELRAALAEVNLSLARDKLQIRIHNARSVPDELASVYHPEYDSRSETRSALRTVWAEATQDPVRKRRRLRFALPRMAKECDDVAVPFALAALTDLPWEAPRLVSYLAAFAEQPRVQHGVAQALCRAVTQGDIWRTSHLLSLACRLPSAVVAPEAIPAVLNALAPLRSSPAWGLAIRFLALHCVGSAGDEAQATDVPDPRAALAVQADLGLSLDIPAASCAKPTAEWLSLYGAAPSPRVDSIL